MSSRVIEKRTGRLSLSFRTLFSQLPHLDESRKDDIDKCLQSSELGGWRALQH